MARSPRRGGGLRAVAELRFRVAVRRLRSRQGTADAIAQGLLYAITFPLGVAFAILVGAGSYRAARAGHGVQTTVAVTAILYGLWQTWTAVSLTVNERDTLDLRRLLLYPVRPGRIYALGLVAGVVADPFAFFWLLLLGGMVAGAAAARPGPWIALLALTALAFAAATVALVALLQEALARLARRRHWRELAALAAIAAWLGVVAMTSAGPAALRNASRVLRVLRWLPFPAAFATEAARSLYAAQALAAVPWIALLLAGAAASGVLAYRVGLATARSGREGAVAGPATARRRGWAGAVGPLLEKELLYLARHPAARIYFVVLPAIAALVGWRLPAGRAGERSELVRVLPLFAIAAYVHLALQMFWVNGLGWERGGARALFLAPIAPERVLAAKNAALGAYTLALFAAAGGAYVATAGPPPAWAAAGAILLATGLAPFLYGAGNVVSVVLPRAAPLGVQRAGSISAMAAVAGMGITSATLAVFAFPVLIATTLDRLWIVPAGWALLGAAGLAAWRVTLPAAGRLLARRREAVLAAVSGDEPS